MALTRVLTLAVLLGMQSAALADAKRYDLAGCADEIAEAFQPLLRQRRVVLVEPPRAAMTLLASSIHCPVAPATRERARHLAGLGAGMLSPTADAAQPTQPWLAELAFGYGLPRATGPSRDVLLEVIETMTAYSSKAVPLAQALFVMANFEYGGPESADGVPIVGDVLLGALSPGCGYGRWFECDAPRMQWSSADAARVRRWYQSHPPR